MFNKIVAFAQIYCESMRIKEIKFHSHPILGELMLNFTKDDGSIYDNVIFIGENGVGKSSIIEGMANFLNKKAFDGLEYIKYNVNGEELKAIPVGELGFYDMIKPDGTSLQMHTNSNNHNSRVDDDPRNIRYTGCMISKARANFQVGNINATTNLNVDVNKHENDDSSDFTSLKQLLVDIANLDNEKYSEINEQRGTNPMTKAEFDQTSLMSRFRTAFNSFFDSLQFNRVSSQNGSKQILFVKHGKDINIDDLSTGEKQIVYRGGMLLRNQRLLEGGIVIVDEPELSMHPRWQCKVLDFYKDLFTVAGQQTVQMFMASHSEHLLKSALKDTANTLVILLKDENGTIKSRRVTGPVILHDLTYAEINFEAFGMPSTDYHIALYSQLQTNAVPGQVLNIKQTDEYITHRPEYNAALHNIHSFGLGATSYETLPTYIRNGIDHPDSGNDVNDSNLEESIKLLRQIC